jgi:hypothetical protein
MLGCETMTKTIDPFRFLLFAVAGWMNQKQQHAIEYLWEENRVLRAQIGGRRLPFTDDQRRSLAAKARLPGRKMLAEVATIVTPQTLLAWHLGSIDLLMPKETHGCSLRNRHGVGGAFELLRRFVAERRVEPHATVLAVDESRDVFPQAMEVAVFVRADLFLF